MATRTINVLGQAIIANQWLFSAAAQVPNGNWSICNIQVTDPSNHWFTRTGNVKEFGIQLQGYVGAEWDNIDPWLGWGWFLYTPGGDPTQNLLLPDSWIPFGRTDRLGHIPLHLGINNLSLVTNQNLRLAVQTDADITLGLTITLNT